VDNHDRKRREDIARTLVDGAIIIMVILKTLDEIGLAPHAGDDARERIAEDFMLVHRDIIPSVEAPAEILALVRSILLDWVTLNDLVALGTATEITPRRLDTMEELAARLVATMGAARDLGLIRDE
jgi:hypothetical protein